MPTLHWIVKEKVTNHHLEMPFKRQSLSYDLFNLYDQGDSFPGKYNDTASHFYYNADGIITLGHAFLSTMKTKAQQYVIYADNCLLTKNFITRHHIIFKKISRDVNKF